MSQFSACGKKPVRGYLLETPPEETLALPFVAPRRIHAGSNADPVERALCSGTCAERAYF